MIDFFKKQGNFAKFEFWAFTTGFAFMMLFFVTGWMNGDAMFEDQPFKYYFEKANVPYSYYGNYFFPQLIHHITLFLTFLGLNFLIIPKIIKRQATLKNLLLLLLVLVASGAILTLTGVFSREYLYTTETQQRANWLVIMLSYEDLVQLSFMLIIYTLIKYAWLYLLSIVDAIHKRFRFITREAIVAAFIWLIVLLLLLAVRAEQGTMMGWAVIIPYGIVFYSFAFHKLIPDMLTRPRPLLSYVLRSAWIIALIFLPLLLFIIAWSGMPDTAIGVGMLNVVFQLFVTVPSAWLLYKRQQKGNEEVTVLKKELKQSTANIDFLRSQINPHFLFNALNTLYGTAIQENAERTGEGIQKLGDMMRFMLQENMQEKISLSREIDYLQNYLALQRLRTDNNPNVQIQTSIESRETIFQIAPMLLIPFVENAFKHGISFREHSHIKINLEIKDRTLYFDVYNSKHNRQNNDPEKDKSGVGLENVRQRLKLLYPNRHELVVRDTMKEFFIHLTIQLA
ncbi:MAG TPA: histidine kinase [Chitinophagaceae bacterium]|nr:histidine kinase [Chitinophagaceae bacterium]